MSQIIQELCFRIDKQSSALATSAGLGGADLGSFTWGNNLMMSLAAGLSLKFKSQQASRILLKYSKICSYNSGRVTSSMCRMQLTVAVSERMDQ